MKLVSPVMGEEEAQATKTVLRAVLGKRILVECDEDKIRHALEALEVAPVYDGAKSELRPGASQLGPFARESDTSRKAALRNYPRAGSQRERLLRLLAAKGLDGRTREELATDLGWDGNTVRPRVRELIDGEWVKLATDAETGEQVTRKTALGNDSEVLVVTDKTRAYLRRHQLGELEAEAVRA